MANWHNKHVPTQWGIAVLGFLVIATALLIPYLGQQQNTQSNAYYGVSTPTPTPTRKPTPALQSCTQKGGVCGKVCKKGTISNAPGCSGAGVKCCRR